MLMSCLVMIELLDRGVMLFSGHYVFRAECVMSMVFVNYQWFKNEVNRCVCSCFVFEEGSIMLGVESRANILYCPLSKGF